MEMNLKMKSSTIYVKKSICKGWSNCEDGCRVCREKINFKYDNFIFWGYWGHWGQTLWEMNKETKSALKDV